MLHNNSKSYSVLPFDARVIECRAIANSSTGGSLVLLASYMQISTRQTDKNRHDINMATQKMTHE
jgi:hypothetical protein